MSRHAPVTRVLVAVDLEAASGPAIAAAGALARLFGASLTAVHAHRLEMPAYFTGAEMDALEAERMEGRAGAAAELEAFVALYTDVPASTRVEEGAPAEAILRLAPAFDLVVVGTRRLHGARRWWLGSVAEAVVRRATVPVLVAPAPNGARPTLEVGTRIAVVGTTDTRADAWLAAFGTAMNAEVSRVADVAHCTPDHLRTAGLVVLTLTRESRGTSLDQAVQMLKECSHPVLFIPAAEAAIPRSPS